MANDNDMAILAESLSEIREAIERVATAIKLKESSVVVVNSDERASSVQEIPQTPQSQRPTAEEALPAQAPQEQPTPASQVEEERPRPLRVESQVLIREPDGSRWIVSVRSYSDGQFREDRKPYKSPVGSLVGTKKT